MTAIKAIETVYKGYKFRSRLEARWAVVFDTLGVKWEYEKEGFDLGNGIYYLPDFWLPEWSMWVEVKGLCGEDDWTKIHLLAKQSGHEVACLGEIPDSDETCGEDVLPVEYPIAVTDDQQRSLLRSMMLTLDTYWSGNVMFQCPFCDCPNIHVSNLVPDNDVWEGQGVAKRIGFTCEWRHGWILRFGFHKGNTYLAIETAWELESDLLVILADRDYDLRNKAVLAGRQARFEHGQKG